MSDTVERVLAGILVPMLVSAGGVIGGWSYLKAEVTKHEVKLEQLDTRALEEAQTAGRIAATLERMQEDIQEIKQSLKDK